MQKKTSQTTEDSNALIQSPSAQAERSIVKSKANYNNASWDLIDADKEGKNINEIKEEDLPIEFQNKTPEEKTKLLKEKKAEREEIQKQISSLAKERQAYIDAELKKRKESGVQDDFGTSVNNSILEKSKEIGLQLKNKISAFQFKEIRYLAGMVNTMIHPCFILIQYKNLYINGFLLVF